MKKTSYGFKLSITNIWGAILFGLVIRAKSSIIWRGIRKPIETFAEGYTFRIGSTGTSLWYEDWTKLDPLCKLVLVFTSVTPKPSFVISTWMALGTCVNYLLLYL